MSDTNTDRMDGEEPENDLPLCYDDRHSTAFSHLDHYIFISYSHCDKDAVYADLKQLYEIGLHFWYDKKLRAGDLWDERVKEKIESEQCVGVLFFTSLNTVKSEAVERELELCKEIVEERGKAGKRFTIIPVTLNGMSILQTVREAFLSCADLDGNQLSAALPQKRVKTGLEMLPDRLLYVPRSADGSHIARIVAELKQFEDEADCKLFCGSEEVQKRFEHLPNVEISDGRRFIKLGEYPQELDGEAPCYLREGICRLKDRKFSVLGDGRAYRFSPLKWQILRFGEETLTAVTEKIIDRCTADEIDPLIARIRTTAFADGSIIDDLRLIDFGLLREFKNTLAKWDDTDFAKKTNKFHFFPLYWGLNGGRPAPFYRDPDVKIMDSYKNVKDLFAGVRLVADFKTDALLRYFEKENIQWN